MYHPYPSVGQWWSMIDFIRLPILALLLGMISVGNAWAQPRQALPAGYLEQGGPLDPYQAYIPLSTGEAFILASELRLVLRHGGHLDHSSGDKASDAPHAAHRHGFMPDTVENIFIRFEGGKTQARLGFSGDLGYPVFKHGPNGSQKVAHYQSALLPALYPKVDLHWQTTQDGIRFDYQVAPGGDVTQLALLVEGCPVRLKRGGDLLLDTRSGPLTLTAPYAYQESTTGKRRRIPSRYRVESGTGWVRIDVGAYDRSRPLIIDPTLVFSSYSGSQADNWAGSACFDTAGNAYLIGVVYGRNFPTTPGVFSPTASSTITTTVKYDQCDLGIVKFSADGRQRLYTSFLGGTAVEVPHSSICDSAGNLILFGSTSSQDFPTTPGAMEPRFRGSGAVSPLESEVLRFNNGVDGFVTRINPTGSQILASTYLGGGNVDVVMTASNPLVAVYGDQFRGEVIVGRNNDIFVATTTASADVPVAGGGRRASAGGYDVYVTQLNASLALVWGTTFGGNQDDAAYTMRMTPRGTLLLAGGTLSNNLATTAGAPQPSNSGTRNQVEGWLAELTPGSSDPSFLTYVGTPAYDQPYLLETDSDGGVYLLGQTLGQMGHDANRFGVDRGGLFIRRYLPSLNQIDWTVQIGGRPGELNIRPTAFMIDECGQLYFAGWGGRIQSGSASGATTTTVAMPVTSDAFKSATDGGDFYLGVLTSGARALKYGSFFGGNASSRPEHVDGGTSRFDSRGIVYQAVCASCGGGQVFPTSPGVIGPRNLSNNCNSALFKFDFRPLFEPLILTASIDTVCSGDVTTILHNSVATPGFRVDFGDGRFDTLFANQHQHRYAAPGEYTVRVSGLKPGCPIRDTASVRVNVLKAPPLYSDSTYQFCIGDTIRVELPVSSPYRVTWSPPPGPGLDTARSFAFVPERLSRHLISVTEDSTGCVRELGVAFLPPSRLSPSVQLGGDPCTLPRPVTVTFPNGAENRRVRFGGQGIDSMPVSRALLENRMVNIEYQYRELGCLVQGDTLLEVSLLAMPDTQLTVRYAPVGCERMQVLLVNRQVGEYKAWLTDRRIVGYGDSVAFTAPAGRDRVRVTVLLQTGSCTDSISWQVPVPRFELPNVITPNGDGANDGFEPPAMAGYRLELFNRWGRLVHAEEGPTPNRWRADKAQAGTYYYQIRYPEALGCRGWLEVIKSGRE